MDYNLILIYLLVASKKTLAENIMANFIQSVDERTQLAGANRLEILLFSLGLDKNTGREEVFGLNVFKIREVIQVLKLHTHRICHRV